MASCGGGSSETPAEKTDNDKSDSAETPDDKTDTADSTSDTGAESGSDTGSDTGDTNTTDSGSDTGSDTGDTGADTAPVDSNTCSNEGELRVGDTVCPDNPKGLLYQKCEGGSWVDTEECILCDHGEYPKVCGTYAQKMWFTSVSKIGPISAAEGWTRTYFLIEQEQEQDKVHAKATYCKITIGNDQSGLLAIVMPQSFADALGTTVKESKLVTNADGTIGFEQDVLWEIRAIDPNCYGDNPAAYTLPTEPNNECVQDWDNDERAGLTVNAKGSIGGNASLGMVEKSSSTIYNGIVSDDGATIYALVDWTDEQKILVVEGGSDTSVLKLGANNQQQNSSKQPGFTGPFNFIQQFKIPEKSDCEYIRNNALTIFPADPPVPLE